MRIAMQNRSGRVCCAAVVALLGSSCKRADREPAPTDGQQSAVARVCATPARGIIISPDTVASFSTRSTLGEHTRRCSLGSGDFYTAVGWQAASVVFPFAGAKVMAVQTKRTIDQPLLDSVPADLWTAEGDSVRLPDGHLMPRTLGALKARYGHLLVFEGDVGDDADGPQARVCKFPSLLFRLTGGDSAGKLSGAAAIAAVEMAIESDSEWVRLCAEAAKTHD